MPTRPARKGFAPAKNCHRGWRDKVGFTFRPGRAVFVVAAHGAWAVIPAGKAPARLFRAFHYVGDRLGKFRLDAEYTWCLDYRMLEVLGPDVMDKVPADILAIMRDNPRVVVQTNWAVSDEFETVTGDCAIHRLLLDAQGGVATQLPEDDADAAILAGTLFLARTPGGVLKQHMWADRTWHNYATGFTRWAADTSLEDTAPAGLVTPPHDGPVPLSADYAATIDRFTEVEAGGGPTITAQGEQLAKGADETRIYGVSYIDGDDGVTRYAYIDGDPYAPSYIPHPTSHILHPTPPRRPGMRTRSAASSC